MVSRRHRPTSLHRRELDPEHANVARPYLAPECINSLWRMDWLTHLAPNDHISAVSWQMIPHRHRPASMYWRELGPEHANVTRPYLLPEFIKILWRMEWLTHLAPHDHTLAVSWRIVPHRHRSASLYQRELGPKQTNVARLYLTPTSREDLSKFHWKA